MAVKHTHHFYGHLARRLRGLTFFMGVKFPILQWS